MRHADRAVLAAFAVLAGSATALAAPSDRIDVQADRPGDVRLDGHMVVRVTPATARQLGAVQHLADSVWTERPGVGPIDIQISPDKLEVLRQLGLDPVVVIPDVQHLIDAEWAQIQRADLERADQRPLRSGTYDPVFYQTYQQLPDIHARLNTLAAARPDLASVEDIGDGLEDIGGGDRRDLVAIRVTGPDQPGNLRDDRPVIIWQGGQHAREWVSPATVTYLADMLIEQYDTDPRVKALVDAIDFRIIPVSNPDGYAYTWTGSSQRLWRKNRRNGHGVDLNRNWSYEWGGTGSSGSTSSETYRGTAPFSEPETAALRDYATAFGARLASSIDYHCYSQLILWPFGYESGLVTPEPDRTFFDDLSTDMSSVIQSESGQFYDPIQSWELYPAAGVADDWYYGALGVYSLTIELRDTGTFGFVLPAEQIIPTAEENYEAALLFAERTALALSIWSQGELPSRVPADTISPVQIGIFDGLESVDAPTATIHTSVDGGAFTPAPMSALGGSTFEGTLPAAPCGSTVSYYFTAQSTSGTTATFPAGGAAGALSAESFVETVGFADDMETDTGWTVGAPGDTATTGVWERANPVGTSAQPENDHTDAGTLCWITGASATSVGSNDIDGGNTTLTSPTMDATDPGATLSYWRWFSNNQGAEPNLDVLTVEISDDDGASWSTLEVVNENAGMWLQREYLVSDHVANTDLVRLRFTAGDLGSGSIVEAGVDDVRVSSFACPATGNPADVDGDGDVDADDIAAFVTAFTDAIDGNADIDNDGDEDADDIAAFVTAFVNA